MTVVTFNSSAQWTCPANVFSALVQSYAGGSGGAAGGVYGGGGGGGGGGYASDTVVLVPGQVYNAVVGQGGLGGTALGGPQGRAGGATSFAPYQAGSQPFPTTVAGGGQASVSAGTGSLGGSGLLAGGPGGPGVFLGGPGGGGGGCAAGPSGATGQAGQAGVNGGGSGGSGAAFPSSGLAGAFPGGGGGAGCGKNGSTPTSGGNGAGGQLILTYTVTPPTVPTPPLTIAAYAGNGAATVSWTRPASNGGTPITGYTATASPGGHTATVAGTQGSAVITGLTNGTAYTFTVVATNTQGNSPASAVSPTVTPTTTPPISGGGPPTPADKATLQVMWDNQNVILIGALASLSNAQSTLVLVQAKLNAIADVSPLLSSPDQAELNDLKTALGTVQAQENAVAAAQANVDAARALLSALTDAIAVA